MSIDLEYLCLWWKIYFEGRDAYEMKQDAVQKENFERAALIYDNFIR